MFTELKSAMTANRVGNSRTSTTVALVRRKRKTRRNNESIEQRHIEGKRQGAISTTNMKVVS